jgi:hypothetical protein
LIGSNTVESRNPADGDDENPGFWSDSDRAAATTRRESGVEAAMKLRRRGDEAATERRRTSNEAR